MKSAMFELGLRSLPGFSGRRGMIPLLQSVEQLIFACKAKGLSWLFKKSIVEWIF